MGLGLKDLVRIIFLILRTHITCKKPVYCTIIDLEKAFDWAYTYLLFYALLNFNIYTNTFSCLKINNYLTQWFGVNSGVRQEDTLSPTLFAIYINSLAKEIKELGLGIDINGNKVLILLYADRMVLIGKKEERCKICLM